ncbi:MAG: hypothetical protein ABUM51_11250 [Bacteroidota bacterium]
MNITIYVPVGFIMVFMSLYIFREYNRVKRAKRDERRESLDATRQEYLDRLIKSRNKESNPDPAGEKANDD